MSLTIISLPNFAREVKALHKRYRKIGEDLSKLRSQLIADPKAGVPIGDHCYKIRLANRSVPTGKSGGFRVVYYYLDGHEDLYLISIDSKSDLENISDTKITDILKEEGIV